MTERLLSRMTNQVFGLVLMTASTLMMLVVTVLLFDPAEATLPVVLSLVLAGAAYVVWRFDKIWATAVGLLVALGAAGTVFFLAFGVFQLFSPIEFVAGLLLVLGFLFALIGGIGSIIRQVRGSAPGGERIRQGALILLGVGAVVSIGGFFFTRSTVDAAEASGAVVVDMTDFEFEPGTVSVTAGEQLLLTNSDAFAHDFTLDDYDLYTYFGPGSEALVDVSELPPGTYSYYCSLHTFDGEGMIGTLTVES